ncbi:MAG: hypothetical protein R3A13_01540 [Bdellovibrionota bacterium]
MKPKFKNPKITKLLEALEHMPEYLEERRRKIKERREFVRKVFESACKQAGLVK